MKETINSYYNCRNFKFLIHPSNSFISNLELDKRVEEIKEIPKEEISKNGNQKKKAGKLIRDQSLLRLKTHKT